jgi:hypothetical protein
MVRCPDAILSAKTLVEAPRRCDVEFADGRSSRRQLQVVVQRALVILAFAGCPGRLVSPSQPGRFEVNPWWDLTEAGPRIHRYFRS